MYYILRIGSRSYLAVKAKIVYKLSFLYNLKEMKQARKTLSLAISKYAEPTAIVHKHNLFAHQSELTF